MKKTTFNSEIVTWESTMPSPCGNGQPVFVSKVEVTAERATVFGTGEEIVSGAEILFELHDGDWALFNTRSGELVTYDAECEERGRYTVDAVHETGAELPRTGWSVHSAWSDQTGGMCMIDVIRFENGVGVTVTAECIGLACTNEAAYNEVDEGGLIVANGWSYGYTIGGADWVV
jgi:hypothetical protein